MKLSIQQWNKCEIFSIIYNNIRYIYIYTHDWFSSSFNVRFQRAMLYLFRHVITYLFQKCRSSHSSANWRKSWNHQKLGVFLPCCKPVVNLLGKMPWWCYRRGGLGNWWWESCQKRWVLDALDIGITKPEKLTPSGMKDLTTDSLYMHSHPRSAGRFLGVWNTVGKHNIHAHIEHHGPYTFLQSN